jgi:hypothetical protein
MNAPRRDPFQHPGSWKPTAKLEELGEPPHRVLARLIHGCAPDEATRTATATALLLSLWQLHGRKLTDPSPSLLLVSPEGPDDDPINQLAGDLVYHEDENKPVRQTRGPFAFIPVEKAAQVMQSAYREHLELQNKPGADALSLRNARWKFQSAYQTACGSGPCRPYAQAWHDDYGLLTNRDDQIILRLHTKDDREALRQDMYQNPDKLMKPQGLNMELSRVVKHLSLSGALGIEEAHPALKLIDHGHPVLFLPHRARDPLVIGHRAALDAFVHNWRAMRVDPVKPSLRLPETDWIHTYRDALRRRLAHLPADYEFVISQLLRQLFGVCEHLASFAGAFGLQTPENEVGILFRDLYHHALRGITLSVAGLAWFGPGLPLDPLCEPHRQKALKLIEHLRSGTTVTSTDLLKNYHLKAAERDALLDRLEEEGLLKREGKRIEATCYREFVDHLYAREEFPAVENAWPTWEEALKAEKEKQKSA